MDQQVRSRVAPDDLPIKAPETLPLYSSHSHVPLTQVSRAQGPGGQLSNGPLKVRLLAFSLNVDADAIPLKSTEKVMQPNKRNPHS